MYLLGNQQVADLISRDQARPVFGWLAQARPGPNELFVSALSIGQVAHMVESLPAIERGPWRRLLAQGRRSLEAMGSVIDVDLAAVDVWAGGLRGADLIDEDLASGERYPLGEDDRLVIATAISRNYSLVTRSTPVLDAIAGFTTLTIVEP